MATKKIRCRGTLMSAPSCGRRVSAEGNPDREPPFNLWCQRCLGLWEAQRTRVPEPYHESPKPHCQMCDLEMEPDDSVFDGKMVCETCFRSEGERSVREDVIPGTESGGIPGLRTRPPKYMLDPSEYKQFGY